MTTHKRQIVVAILSALSTLDGGLMSESLLHGAVAQATVPPATLSEFEDTLKHCEAQRWVSGMNSRFDQRKWAITEMGEMARRELNQG